MLVSSRTQEYQGLASLQTVAWGCPGGSRGNANQFKLLVHWTGLTNSSRFGAKPLGALVSRPRWAPGRASALEKLPLPMRYRPGVSS